MRLLGVIFMKIECLYIATFVLAVFVMVANVATAVVNWKNYHLQTAALSELAQLKARIVWLEEDQQLRQPMQPQTEAQMPQEDRTKE
jgi:hypothetical protein